MADMVQYYRPVRFNNSSSTRTFFYQLISLNFPNVLCTQETECNQTSGRGRNIAINMQPRNEC